MMRLSGVAAKKMHSLSGKLQGIFRLASGERPFKLRGKPVAGKILPVLVVAAASLLAILAGAEYW